MKYLIILFFSFSAAAHPVIYQDGWVMSSMTMADMTDAQVNYSFHPRWAGGVNYWRLQSHQGVERELYLGKINHLLWRRNTQDSQANIYLHTGFGDGWLAGMEADWETRRHFLGLKHMHLGQREFDTDIWVARVGYSPFEASFEGLQAWGMMQVWYDRFGSREAKVGPLLRLFYHNVLWEMGATFKGDMMLNLMVHL